MVKRPATFKNRQKPPHYNVKVTTNHKSIVLHLNLRLNRKMNGLQPPQLHVETNLTAKKNRPANT